MYRYVTRTSTVNDRLSAAVLISFPPGGGGLPYETDGDARRLA